MKIMQSFRLSELRDNKFGFLFLASLMAPLVIILQSPEQMETPKFVLWTVCVAISFILSLKLTAITFRINKFLLFAMMLLLFWTSVSTIFSFDAINSVIGTNIRLTSSLLFTYIWIVWILLITSHSDQKLDLLFRAIVISGGVAALLGLLQSFGIGYYGGITEQSRVLVPSVFGNPNFTAMFLVPVVVLGGYFIFTTKVYWQRIVYLVISLLGAYNILFNTSRGGVFGLLGGLLVLALIFIYLRNWRWLLYCSIALGVFLSVSYLFLDAVRPLDTIALASLSDTTTQQRLLLWNRATEFIITNPLTGSGPGNFFIAYRLNSDSSLVDFPWFDDVHNLLLHVTASTGLPAGLALLTLILAGVFQSLMVILKKGQHAVWAGVLLSALVGWLIAASFNPVSVPNWIIFGLMLAGIYVLSANGLTIHLPRGVRILLGVIALVIFLWSIAYQFSDLAVYQSSNALYSNNIPKAQRFVSIALRLNPTNVTAIMMQGSIYLSSKDVVGLEKIADRLIALHPRSTGMVRAAAAMYYQTYKINNSQSVRNKMTSALERYVTTHPYGAQTYQEVAYFYMQLSDLDKALYYAKRYAVLANDNYYSWILLAKISSLSENKELTVYALKRALLIQPSRDLWNRIENAKNPSVEAVQVQVPFNFGEIGW